MVIVVFFQSLLGLLTKMMHVYIETEILPYFLGGGKSSTNFAAWLTLWWQICICKSHSVHAFCPSAHAASDWQPHRWNLFAGDRRARVNVSMTPAHLLLSLGLASRSQMALWKSANENHIDRPCGLMWKSCSEGGKVERVCAPLFNPIAPC